MAIHLEGLLAGGEVGEGGDLEDGAGGGHAVGPEFVDCTGGGGGVSGCFRGPEATIQGLNHFQGGDVAGVPPQFATATGPALRLHQPGGFEITQKDPQELGGQALGLGDGGHEDRTMPKLQGKAHHELQSVPRPG